MSAEQCQCGRPAQGANLCPTCGEELRANLTKIADRWPDLEQALTTPGTGGEQGRTRNGMIAVGTNVNEAAVRARRACTDVVWFILQVIREDRDTMGKPLISPIGHARNRSQDDTPSIARWIASWHIGHITHKTAQETAEEVARDVARAEHLTYQVTETSPLRKVPTGLPCEGHQTAPEGYRIPCGGVMAATLTDSMPDLVCSVDPTHRIPPDVWSRNYWRSHHVPMNETAARNLMGRITG